MERPDSRLKTNPPQLLMIKVRTEAAASSEATEFRKKPTQYVDLPLRLLPIVCQWTSCQHSGEFRGHNTLICPILGKGVPCFELIQIKLSGGVPENLLKASNFILHNPDALLFQQLLHGYSAFKVVFTG